MEITTYLGGSERFQHIFLSSLPTLHGESVLSPPKVGLGQGTCSGQWWDEDRSSRVAFGAQAFTAFSGFCLPFWEHPPSLRRKTCSQELKPLWPGPQNKAHGKTCTCPEGRRRAASANLQTHQQERNAHHCYMLVFCFVLLFVMQKKQTKYNDKKKKVPQALKTVSRNSNIFFFPPQQKHHIWNKYLASQVNHNQGDKTRKDVSISVVKNNFPPELSYIQGWAKVGL